MRVLLVANTAASMVWFRLPLMRMLAARGHEVWVLAPEDAFVPRITATGARFLALPTAQGWSLEGLPDGSYFEASKHLATVAAITRACRQVRPDVVLAYTHIMALLTPPAARLAGVSRVHGMVTGLGYADLGGGSRAEAMRLAFHASLRVAAALSTSLIFLNPDNVATVRRRRLVPEPKLYWMDGEGLDTTRFDAPAPTPAPGALTFVTVARLVHYKGVATFVAAAERVRRRAPACRFLVVGSADPSHPDAIDPATLQAWRDAGVVELLGHVDDMPAVYRQADVFVLASKGTEGLPMSIMEAMAMRRPILTTAEPGNRETVQEGVNGFLVDADDPQALADRMIWLAEHAHVVPALGEASRRRCLDRFDADKVNAALLAHLGL